LPFSSLTDPDAQFSPLPLLDRRAWWEDLEINALEIAKGLWEERRCGKTEPPASANIEENDTTGRN
jgi:hypothetical protein